MTRIRNPFVFIEARQAHRCARPQHPGTVYPKAGNVFARQAFRLAVASGFSVSHSLQPISLGSDPQVAGSILQDRPDNTPRHLVADKSPLVAAQGGQTGLGPCPQTTASILVKSRYLGYTTGRGEQVGTRGLFKTPVLKPEQTSELG